ncbi:MAG: hypothetical protein RMJ59_08345 [Candidatus Nitrosocaldus sp.]|nr:hypothetical protein [Candidatus Nitrosocaldus sp.]MCS7141715.1 hypothetical protein [Candidatus Nitrosocaldus sp.]MDW8000733.1 hypothetical protein [Candidatus Nitrosocaldus sp.]MDW8276370.1 hypothetical protein [Candidatus Nitrosocaldus sp.]
MLYLGEGSVRIEEIASMRDAKGKVEYSLVWGRGKDSLQDDSFYEYIHPALEHMQRVMEWRSSGMLGALFKKADDDPIAGILGGKSKEFYRAFHDLYKGRIGLVCVGDRYSSPFILFNDPTCYVAALANPESSEIFYGYGLLEAWRADPRIHDLNGKGVDAFTLLFSSSIAFMLTLYINAGLAKAREVSRVFDPNGVLAANLREWAEYTSKGIWPGSHENQRRAMIALRGYLNAWFDFLKDSSWLEIHHTLHHGKVIERDQSFLDTATTEISETSRAIILDNVSVFSAEEMERRDRLRREKQLEWTLLRIALGILYPREKAKIREVWERERRRVSWRYLEDTYYEEIWDLIRLHLAGEDIYASIEEKDTKTLGRWHFIFNKKAERPREKVVELEKMEIERIFERKNRLLAMLTWEGVGLPPDARWHDVVARFRKIMIKYHPDRTEVTGVNPEEAHRVTKIAIDIFRELEIIHDLHPEVFGLATLPVEQDRQ